jgi:hypothetical protein
MTNKKYKIMNLDVLLRKIGMSVFVQILYPELMRDKNVSIETICERHVKFAEFTLNSQRSRLSSAKTIFRDGLERQALKLIAKSDQVDNQVRTVALNLINGPVSISDPKNIVSFTSYDELANRFKPNLEKILELYKKGQYTEAKDLVSDLLSKIKELEFDNEPMCARDVVSSAYASAGDIYGELGESDTATHYYKLSMYYRNCVKSEFSEQTNIHLFQFRKATPYALANLAAKQFTMTTPLKMNDPMDSLIYVWSNAGSFGKNTHFKKHLAPLKKSFNYFRIASFSRDKESALAVENTLMWSHYADEHCGFCIEYEFNQDDFRRKSNKNKTIAYLKSMNYPTTDKPLNLADCSSISLSDAVATKAKNWEYENEVRMISYNPLIEGDFETFKLSKKSRIVAIYFGLRCPDYVQNLIRQILLKTDVKFYKMKVNLSNVYKLEYEEV